MGTLGEKFNHYLNNFQWPTKNQWRQFWHVLNRWEKYLLFFFCLLTLSGLIILGIKFYYNRTEIKPAQGGTLIEAVIGAPRFLNPVLNQLNDTDRNLTALIFSGLLKYNGEGNLINDLAESYNISEAGKIYEITLKKNIKWQDGKPLTVDDVIFTLQLIQNPEYKSPLRPAWQGIEIEKINGSSLRLKLRAPYALFLPNLTFGILPKHLWENVTPSSFPLNDLNLKPIGSGPYQFSKLQKDKSGSIKSLELKSFDEYFGGEPFIPKIIFQFYPDEETAISAYKKGEVAALSFVSPKGEIELKGKNGELNIYSLTLPRYFAVFFNQTQSKFLAEKNIREALAYAVNKKELIQEVLKGRGQEIDSPVLDRIMSNPTRVKIYDFNPDQAKNILATAGWKDSDSDNILEKDKQKLEITLTTSDWPELNQTAQLLQKHWSQVGVKVNLDIKEMTKIQNEIIRPRQYQALLFGEVLGLDPDPFAFWHSSQKRDPGLNLALYESREVDKLLEEARQDLDSSSRASKYQAFAKLISEDLPAIFLFNPEYLFAAKKQVKGIELKNINMPSAIFSQMNHWYIKTKRAWK